MKNTKRKVLLKTAKKQAKKNIEDSLLVEVKKIVANIGTGSGKLEKIIKAGSSKLAKKIANEIKLDELAITSAQKNHSNTTNTEAVTAARQEVKPTKLQKTTQNIEKPANKKAKASTVITAS